MEMGIINKVGDSMNWIAALVCKNLFQFCALTFYIVYGTVWPQIKTFYIVNGPK